MRRAFLTLAFGLALATLVGAQGPPRPSLTPKQQLDLFRKNRALIEGLVDSGIDGVRTSDPLKRSESYQGLIKQLQREIEVAAAAGDRSRVVELGTHLKSLLNDGLSGNLANARLRIQPGSADERTFTDLNGGVDRAVQSLDEAIRGSGRLAEDPEVKRVLDDLRKAQQDLGKRPAVPVGGRLITGER